MSRMANPISDLYERVDRLFGKVAAMEKAEALAYLRTVKEHQQVVDRVISLIDTDENSDADFRRFATRADFGPIFDDSKPSDDLSGTTIEGLQLQRKLGAGGMGDIYLARDTRLDRLVAVKTIRDTYRFNERAKERFRREAHILSRLDHPGICRIFSLIESETMDFLVLEYVDGLTLALWLETQPSQRRKLSVCRALLAALAKAHQAGVVHRDIKPDNIMVLGKDQVKFLDFGISRLLTGADNMGTDPETEPGLRAHPAGDGETMPGAILGTVDFMSPEQARGQPAGTASDIFTLGIIFEKMFSSNPAGRVDTITAPGDVVKLIGRMKLDAPAARPTAVEAASVLERNRTRPQRRLRWAMLAAVVGLAFAGGVKYILDLSYEREQAEQSRIEAEQISEFMSSLFKVSDPGLSKGETITARELLDRGAAKIDQSLADQPLAMARLKLTIGGVYIDLGLYDSARLQLLQALNVAEAVEPVDFDLVTDILLGLGTLEFNATDFEASESYLDRALQTHRKRRGNSSDLMPPIHSQLASVYARTNRSAQALELNLDILAVYRQSPARYTSEIPLIRSNISLIYWRQEQLDEAESYARLALDGYSESGMDDLEFQATLLSNLSLIQADAGQFEASAKNVEAAVKIREQIYGEDHHLLGLAYDNLAFSMFKAGDISAAAKWNLKALGIYRDTMGTQNADYAYALGNRGVLLRELGDLDGSEKALLEVVGIMQALAGDTDTDLAFYSSRLGATYLLQERQADARDVSAEAVRIYTELGIPIASTQSGSWLQLADSQNQLGEVAAARATLEDLLERLNAAETPDPDLIENASAVLAELGSE